MNGASPTGRRGRFIVLILISATLGLVAGAQLQVADHSGRGSLVSPARTNHLASTSATGRTIAPPTPAAVFPPEIRNGSSTPGWENISASTGATPDYRDYGRSLAYDAKDGYVVLFGGDGASGYLADTWAFHGGKWTLLHPKVAPSGRDHSTLAYDPVDGYLVLFGGSTSSTSDADTWTFSGGNWTLLHGTTHPSSRWGSSLAWDPADQVMLLFGGCGGAALGDTWTFLHGNWTQLHPKASPTSRENPQLVSDPAANTTVLFGGDNYGGSYAGDTWTFNAGNWTQVTTPIHPAARSMASMAYDPALPGVVLFGGSGASYGMLGDTWLFRDGNWSQATPSQSPAARYFGMMSDDPADSEVVLFGGAGAATYNDTWVYRGFNMTGMISTGRGSAPLTVSFVANETGGDNPTFQWNFGDGNGTTNAATTYIYTQPGMYFPTVSVVDEYGATATASFVVLVGAPLAVTALATPTDGTVPLTVSFAALASGGNAPYSYAWASGSGNSSSLPAPYFTYGAPGTYNATVRVTDAFGVAQNRNFSIHVQGKVIAPLEVTLTASTLSGPAPLLVFFRSNVVGGVAPYTLNWNFGDGTQASGPDVQHSFDAVGTLPVTLTVHDARGVVDHASVTITPTSGIWAQASSEPTSAPAKTNVSFFGAAGGGTPPYIIVWNFGDGAGATVLNTSHQYSSAATYTASLTVIDALGHSASQSLSLKITAASVIPPPATTTPASTAGTTPGTVSIVVGIVVGAVIIAAAIALSRSKR
ncbi:MAG: PKD domain-containing protein [Thermoplasmata archaeon]|nr:PKD domain-containing protein [Thermoplasmata archaeon]